MKISKVLLLASLFLFICILLNSCDNKPRNSIVFKNFPQEAQLIFEKVLKFDKRDVRKLFLKDSSIIVWNIDGATDFFFYQYSLKSNILIRKFIKGGRSYGQALGAFSGGFNDNRIIWFQDISLNKLLTVDLSLNKIDSDTLGIHEYPMHKLYYSVQLMDSSRLLASGAIEADSIHSFSKLQQVELKAGKEIEEYGSFTNPPNNIPLGSWKMANQAFLFIKPMKDKAVLADRYMDRIEVFDLVTKTTNAFQGPENFEAEFTLLRVHDKDMIQRNSKTKFAFINGMTTNHFIYLLYSGMHENIKPNHANDASCIYVYDWSGKPVKKLNLNCYISSFTVSDNDDIMYAFEKSSGYIVKTKLKI